MFEDKLFSICIIVLPKCERLHCEYNGRLVNAIACIANVTITLLIDRTYAITL